MKLYDPRTWFSKHEKRQDAPLELRCASRRCGEVIEDPFVFYVPAYGQFYHIGECLKLVGWNKIVRPEMPGVIEVHELRLLSREDALKKIRTAGQRTRFL